MELKKQIEQAGIPGIMIRGDYKYVFTESEFRELLETAMRDAWLQSTKKCGEPLAEMGYTGWIKKLNLFE